MLRPHGTINISPIMRAIFINTSPPCNFLYYNVTRYSIMYYIFLEYTFNIIWNMNDLNNKLISTFK